MKPLVRIAALVAAALSLPSATWAQQQPWIKDRRYGEGMGIRAGDLELHPGVAGEVGYDSNYFQNSGDVNPPVIDEPEIAAIRFRLTPSFSVATLGPERREGAGAAARTIDFRARTHATYNEFIATDSQFSDQVSSQRNLEGGVGADMDILPSRPWGADLMADFTRIVQPSNSPDAAAAFDRDTVRGGGGVKWRPGGGLFEWRLGYQIQYNFFEEDIFKDLNNIHHIVQARGRWRFFPRTALLYKGEVEFIRYTQATQQNDANPVRALLGMNGLITNHFAMLVMAGWEGTFYEATGTVVPSNYDGPIGQAELKWYPLPNPALDPTAATVGLSSIAVGYVRSIGNAYLGDYYQNDRGYVDFSYFVGGQFLLSLQGGFSHITRPDISAQIPGFGENRVDATAFAEYRTSNTVGINATFRYNAELDDNTITVTPPPPPQQQDNLKFSRYEAYLGVRWFL